MIKHCHDSRIGGIHVWLEGDNIMIWYSKEKISRNDIKEDITPLKNLIKTAIKKGKQDRDPPKISPLEKIL